MPATLLSVFMLLSAFESSHSFKILALFTHPSHSHAAFFKPFLGHLVNKGHEVTLLSAFPLEVEAGRSYTHLNLKEYTGVRASVTNIKDGFSRIGDMHNAIKGFKDLASFTCNRVLPSRPFQELVEGGGDTYDVIISELFNTNCVLLPVYLQYRSPVIGIKSHGIMPWSNSWIGNPDNPAYVPNLFMDFYGDMSFLQRLENSLSWIYNGVYFEFVVKRQDCEIIGKYTKHGCELYDAVMNNVSVILANTHFSVIGARPVVPSLVDVAGLHIGKVNKLEQVLLYYT